MLIPFIYVKKLHSLYKQLCKGYFVVGDIKLQRSPLQNSNFVITLSVGFVLTVCYVVSHQMVCIAVMVSLTFTLIVVAAAAAVIVVIVIVVVVISWW